MKGHWVVYELLRRSWQDVYIYDPCRFGEFEQGRPLIGENSCQISDYGILLTFFSPSGYEVRKNYGGRRCLLLAFRSVQQCEEVPGYRELAGIFHQVSIIGRTISTNCTSAVFGCTAFLPFSAADKYSSSGMAVRTDMCCATSTICLCRMNAPNAIWRR